MVRARIFAGVATFAVACALPSVASAQIGPCPTLQPPPCIITDASKIAQTAAELKHKKDELQNTISEVKEMTDFNAILGMVGNSANDPLIAIVKPVAAGQKVTVSQAANQLDAALRAHGSSQADTAAARREDQLRVRAAAGEGYASALAIKARAKDFDTAYADLFQRFTARQEDTQSLQQSKPVSQADQLKMCRQLGKDQFTAWQSRQSSGDANSAVNVEEDWELNNAARILLLNAYLLKREADAGRLQLAAMTSLQASTGGNSGPRVDRREAGPAGPAPTPPQYNIDLGKLMTTVGQLLALKQAASTVSGLLGGIKGARDTQAEYQQMVKARDDSQKAVESLAASDASRKGVSAASLLSRANQVMQQFDRTTWDDPSKRDRAEDAAKRAEAALDSMVSGDVSDNWSKFLVQRAEAFKQEAFFRSINADAKSGEAAAIKALSEYNASISVDATNAQALQAKIGELEAQVADLRGKLNSAPADVISIRDRVIGSLSNQQPVPTPAG